MEYIYDYYEQNKVVELYYKKYGKLIHNVEEVAYDNERGQYIIYTESTMYTLTTKRL